MVNPGNFMLPFTQPNAQAFAPTLQGAQTVGGVTPLNTVAPATANSGNCCAQQPGGLAGGANDMMHSLMGMMMMFMMFIMAMMQQFMGGNAGRRPSLGDFGQPGGSSSPGSSSGPGSTPETGAPSRPIGGGTVGQNGAMQRLANAANASGQQNTRGWCLKGVQDALERAGLGGTRLPSAYMKADQLARDSRFQEINVPVNQLASLPPGAIIVWDRKGDGTSFGQHGHVQITLGGGRAASDHFETVRNLGTRHRVFIPKG